MWFRTGVVLPALLLIAHASSIILKHPSGLLTITDFSPIWNGILLLSSFSIFTVHSSNNAKYSFRYCISIVFIEEVETAPTLYLICK